MAIANISICKETLPFNKTLKSTSYQIAVSPFFNEDDIVVNISQDIENLYGRLFDLDFDSNSVYYGRVKLHFDDNSEYGWTKPIMLTKEGDNFSCNITVITTPKVTIEGDIKNCELGGFKIFSSEFRTINKLSRHKYTDWIIRSVDGSIVFQSLKDYDNLTKIRVPYNTLKPDRLYIVEVTYISDDNNKSNAGRIIIKTLAKPSDAENLNFNDNVRSASIPKDEYDALLNAYNDLLEDYVNRLALADQYEKAYNELLKECVNNSALKNTCDQQS